MRKSRGPERRKDLPFPVSAGNRQTAFFPFFSFLTFIPEKDRTGYLRFGIRLRGTGEVGMNYANRILQFSKQAQIAPINTLVRQTSSKILHKWILGHLSGKLGPPISFSLFHSPRQPPGTQCSCSANKLLNSHPQYGFLYSSLPSNPFTINAFLPPFHFCKNSQLFNLN